MCKVKAHNFIKNKLNRKKTRGNVNTTIVLTCKHLSFVTPTLNRFF